MNNDLLIFGGLAVVAYLIYQKSLATSVPVVSAVATDIAYAPIATASGNGFYCPSGTSYHDYGEQASGGGYCQ